MLDKILVTFVAIIGLIAITLHPCNGQNFELTTVKDITTDYPSLRPSPGPSRERDNICAVSKWYRTEEFCGKIAVQSLVPFTAVFQGSVSHESASLPAKRNYETSIPAVDFLPPKGTTSFRIETTEPATLTISTTFFAKESVLKNTDVIERNEWGAEKPKNDYAPQDVDSIIIHHSWYPDAAAYREAESIAGIQRYHMYSNGWDDVGYHYLIGPDGLIFRGRPENAVGAHCVPNTNKIGICMIGNYDPDCDEVTPESWNSLEKLTIEVSKRYDVPPDMLFGHRDFSPKSCPGEAIYSELRTIREKLPFH